MKQKHISSLSREKTRMKAGRLFKKGVLQAEIARKMKVTPGAVCQWHNVWKKKGIKGLKSKGHPGFPSKLTEKKRKIFKKAILKGATAFGYETNLWTLNRLAEIMRKETGVKFAHNQTWKVVRALGFSCQKPQVLAKERDQQAIKNWKEKKLPALKKMGE